MQLSQQDGMVEILQKCLQQYSGVSILRSRKSQQQQLKSDNDNEEKELSSTAASDLFDKLLAIDTEIWDAEIRKGVGHDLSSKKLINEIQKTMVSSFLFAFLYLLKYFILEKTGLEYYILLTLCCHLCCCCRFLL